MAIAHVQSAAEGDLSVAFGSNNTAGNLLICAICSGGDITGVTDSRGNTWVKVDDLGAGGILLFTDLWYVKNCAGGANTVTAGGGFSDPFNGMVIAEYSGCDTAAPLDQIAKASSGAASANADSGSTATTSQADELLIGVVGNNSSQTATWLGSFTERGDVGGASRVVTMGDRIVSATGTYNAAATLSGSTDWQAIIATFKAASGGTAHDRSLSQSMGATNPYARLAGTLRSYAETTAAQNPYARLANALRSPSEMLAGQNPFARLANALRPYADTAGLADAYARLASYKRSEADNAGLAEAYARTVLRLRAYAEMLALTDLPTLAKITAQINRMLSELLGFAEEPLEATGEVDRLLGPEGLGLAEAYARVATGKRATADSAAVQNPYARTAQALRATADSLAVLHVYARTAAGNRSLSDMLALADVAAVMLIPQGVLVLAVAEAAGWSQGTFSRRADALRSPSELAGAAEQMARVAQALRALSESQGHALAYVRQADAARSLSDAAGLAQALALVLTGALAGAPVVRFTVNFDHEQAFEIDFGEA